MHHPSLQHAKLKVLIIEDSHIVAAKYTQLLNAQPEIEVAGVAHNVMFGMQLLQVRKPHVVLLDIHLEQDAPEQNGLTVLARISKEYPEVKVMMLTNLADDIYRKRSLELGATGFFDKSDDFDKVLNAMNEVKNTIEA